MTVSIRIQGANFSKFGDVDPSAAPYIEDAIAFYLLGGDSTESLKNRVPDSPYPTASEIGSPIYGPNYARLTCAEVNGIEGGFNFAQQIHSHVVIVSRNLSTNRLFAGYWKQSGPNAEAAIGMSASLDEIQSYMDSSGRAKVAFNPSLGQFAFMATTYDGTDSKAYGYDGASLQSASLAYAAAGVDTSAPFRIGASGVGAGEFDAAAVMTFNRALSAVELQDLYDYFKQLMTFRSINLL